jgi:hypothetical protein
MQLSVQRLRSSKLIFLVTISSWIRLTDSTYGIHRSENPGLHFDRQTFESLWSQSNGPLYWRNICPNLTISMGTETPEPKLRLQRKTRNSIPTDADLKCLRERLDTDGYYQVDASALNLGVNHADLAQGVMQLEELGWPATFIIMYDEAWTIADEVGYLVRATSGGCENNLDMLAWKIDPNVGEAGFSPHRDRQPDK